MLGSTSEFRKRLLKWYDRSRRDLPWRTPAGAGEPDPYHVLVSETMLQQTQVATVVPYYLRFLRRFPTFQSLADAPEQEVLRLWQGLGYYSRARKLRAAALVVTKDLGGRLPAEPEELMQLPGIGRYTAGAIASIAFGRRAPILDGNVMRVLCRIDRVTSDPRDRKTQQALWRRAEEILPARRVGDFNSALMELGATVCTPRNPQCLTCPVSRHCGAASAGLQESIPAPRQSKTIPLLRRQTYCIVRGNQFLIEQRPSNGRWAAMWQFITLEPDQSAPVSCARPLGTVSHGLTHRRYEFEVFLAEEPNSISPRSDRPQRWVTQRELDTYPLPRPHLRMLEMVRLELNGRGG